MRRRQQDPDLHVPIDFFPLFAGAVIVTYVAAAVCFIAWLVKCGGRL